MSKLGPSLVRSVCSRDIVRVMTGQLQGSSLAGCFTGSNFPWRVLTTEFSTSQIDHLSNTLHFNVNPTPLSTQFTQMSQLISLSMVMHGVPAVDNPCSFVHSRFSPNIPNTTATHKGLLYTLILSTSTPNHQQWFNFNVQHRNA